MQQLQFDQFSLSVLISTWFTLYDWLISAPLLVLYKKIHKELPLLNKWEGKSKKTIMLENSVIKHWYRLMLTLYVCLHIMYQITIKFVVLLSAIGRNEDKLFHVTISMLNNLFCAQLSWCYDMLVYYRHLPDEMTQLAVSNASRSQSAQNKAFSRYTATGSTGSGTAALPHQYQTSNRSGMCEFCCL